MRKLRKMIEPVQPVVDRDVCSARCSRWDDDKAWSSQEWKADRSMDERTGQTVVTSWAIIGNDETDSELSMESRSFLNRVNDQVRKRQKRSWENHSWKYMSLIGDERVFNLQRTQVYVFSDSVLCLGKILENSIERCMGTKIGMVKIFSKLQKLRQNRRRANGIRVEYFPRLQYVAAQ